MVVPTRLANRTRAAGLDAGTATFILAPRSPISDSDIRPGSRRARRLSGNTPVKWGLACSDVVKWRGRVVAPGTGIACSYRRGRHESLQRPPLRDRHRPWYRP